MVPSLLRVSFRQRHSFRRILPLLKRISNMLYSIDQPSILLSVYEHGINIFPIFAFRVTYGLPGMPLEQSKQIRIKDIARRANVSAGTVDRVLHNRGEVSDETRNRILEIITELNYQPNFLASTLASKRHPVFMSLLPAPLSAEGYWSKPASGLRRRMEELHHYGFTTEQLTFNQFDPADFDCKAEQLIGLHPDGVILAPYFYKESLRLIAELRNNHIPFVFIDSEIPGQGQIAFVGQNSYQCGALSARLLSNIAPSGLLVVLHFAKEMDNLTHLMQREKGFYDWFRTQEPERRINTREVSLIETICCDDQLETAFNGDFPAGIYVTNSKVYLAASFLEKRPYESVRVIGHDLLRENIRYLKSGQVDFLIFQHPEEQGYKAMDLLFRHVIQKSPAKALNYTPIDIIVPENADYYSEFN